MRTYIVTVPYRGEQTYFVKARSAAEAKRKASNGAGDDVEPVDYLVTRTYEPSDATLGGAQPGEGVGS